MTTRRPAPDRPRFSAGSPFRETPPQVVPTYVVGDRVTHDKFGLGRVITQETAAVVVDFGNQRARITSPFTRLTKL